MKYNISLDLNLLYVNAALHLLNVLLLCADIWPFLSLLRGSRRRRPYLYRKRAIHRSRPTYSCSLEEAHGSIREGRPRPPPPLNSSNSFMSRRERSKRMTMSVWEQRTSQLRRHRQMSSREVLFSGPSEEKDGPPVSAQTPQGPPLSLHRKAMEATQTGSLKQLTDALDSPSNHQAPGSSMPVDTPLDATLSGDISEPPVVMATESLNVPLADVSVSVAISEPPESDSITESNNTVDQSHNTVSKRSSPRLNGERQHRAVKKFRPPENFDTLTPEMGGHSGIRGRRALHHCDRGQGSSSGNGSHLSSRSVSRERRRNPGKVEEKETDSKKEEELSKPDESRWDRPTTCGCGI